MRPPPVPHRRTDNTPLGIVMMLASVFLFSVMSVFVKASTEDYPVTEVVFFRNAFALIPVGVAVLLHGGIASLRTQKPMAHLWRSVIGLSAMSMLFWSFDLLPLADAVALNFSAPLFLTALSVPFLGEKVGIHRWSAVAVGFAGVLVMVRPSGDVLHLGALAALGAAFAQALAMVAIRQLSRTEAPDTIVFWFTLITTILGLLTLPFAWVTPVGWAGWGLLAGAGLVGGVAQLFLTRAYAYAPAAVVAPFSYASILWATLFGFVLWGDAPAAHVVVGALIVAASGLYILYRETRRRVGPRPDSVPVGDD